MRNYSDALVTLSMYQSIIYTGVVVTRAVRSLGRIQKASSSHFFSTEYIDHDTVRVTRVPTKHEATRDRRSGGAMVHVWPFVGMLPGHTVTYTGEGVDAAVRRVRVLKGQRPDLFFKVVRPDRDTAVITKVETAGEATHQSLNKTWPFKDMAVGQSVEFDVTFLSTEHRQKLSVAAHTNGHVYRKKFSTSARNTASGQRVITVTRIS